MPQGYPRGYAAKYVPFLVLSLAQRLPLARRLVLTAPLAATDGGAGGDYTIAISALSGIVSKSVDPASSDWAANETKIHATFDVGEGGQLLPVGVRLPATVNAALQTEVVFEFNDGTANSVVITNSSTGSTLDSDAKMLANALMGPLGAPVNNNGRSVRKIILRTRNTSASTVTGVDLGAFDVRAWAGPRGTAAAL